MKTLLNYKIVLLAFVTGLLFSCKKNDGATTTTETYEVDSIETVVDTTGTMTDTTKMDGTVVDTTTAGTPKGE